MPSSAAGARPDGCSCASAPPSPQRLADSSDRQPRRRRRPRFAAASATEPVSSRGVCQRRALCRSTERASGKVGASVAARDARLANIRWSAGTLTSAQRLLVTTIVNTSKEEHGGEALFGQNSFAIVGSRRGYDALKKLVVELAAGKQIAEDLPPHAQPWVLHKGICAPSTTIRRTVGISRCSCAKTDEPYYMEISANTMSESEAKSYTSVQMTPMSYMIFPSRLSHRCRAGDRNNRIIINTLLSTK